MVNKVPDRNDNELVPTKQWAIGAKLLFPFKDTLLVTNLPYLILDSLI